MVERYLSKSLPVLLTRSLHDIFNKAHQTLELHKKSQFRHWPDKFCVVQPTQPLIPHTINQAILGAVQDSALAINNRASLLGSY